LSKKDKLKKADKLVKALNKEHGTDIVMRGADMPEREFIPFSSPRANYLTRGGVPEGMVVEFFGAENSGKTTTALDILANFQEKYPDRLALFLDAENTLDEEWGEEVGVDFDKVIVIKPTNQTGNTLLEMVIDSVETGDVGLVIVDSIPFLMSKSQFENDLDDSEYCGNSDLMTKFCRKVVPPASNHNCTIIMINQIRDVVGVHFTMYDTPGGHMLKHTYSQRIQFKKGKLLNKKYQEKPKSFESPMGHLVQLRLTKNKVTKNDRRLGNYTLNYDKNGIDVEKDTLDVAVELGIIEQAGAWYSYESEELGKEVKEQGLANFLDALEDDREVFKDIKNKTNEQAII